MKILVTGAAGQVGWEVARSVSVLGDSIACDRSELDLSRPETLGPAIDKVRPDVIVNAAAYTAVDRAEEEEKLANRINGEAVGEIGCCARKHGALVIHYSTDYVFDGTAEHFYTERDATCPLNAYGRSKLLGEQALASSGCDYLTFRTTWVYASRGKNFLLTMLKLASERETLRVVADQFGAPTSARMIADLTAHVIAKATAERQAGTFASGLYNLTAGGRTSWHGFAKSIVDAARGLTSDGHIKTTSIEPISAADYPTPATRPANSSLDGSAFDRRFGLNRPQWRVSMMHVLQDALSVRL
jgi:dTDP-4-dehydrorhamnose reductase